MITLVASTRRATAVSDDAITTRSVGIPVTLDLSEHFDGLAVTLVCKAGEVSRDVAVLDPSALQVPVDCLQVAGVPLLLGLYASNSAGTKVIPTIWASAGTIRVGTEQSEVSPSAPTPDWTAQVLEWAEDAHDTAERLAQEVDGWETAIDEAVQGAENVDATVSKSGSVATISVTNREGVTHTATVSDGADGRPGADGQPGADGFSPTATVTQTASGATISITDKSGTTTASVSNGTDGTDGADGADGFSPTVDVQPITGGHDVTITDADGPHSFEVMDGDPSAPGSITDEMLAPDGIKPQVAQLFGNQLVGTLSGTIDTAADAYAAPPVALSVEGKSTQAGTPTPDAPVPILSVDGLTANFSPDVLWTNLDDGYVNASGGITGASVAYAEKVTPFIPLASNAVNVYARTPDKPSSDYQWIGIGIYDSNKTFIRRINPVASAIYVNEFEATASISDANAAYIRISMRTYGSNDIVWYYSKTTVPDLLPEGTSLRSLPDGTHDQLNLSYLRPSTRAGWALYSRELVQNVIKSTFDNDTISGTATVEEGPNSAGLYLGYFTLNRANFDELFQNRGPLVNTYYVQIGRCNYGVSNYGSHASATIAGVAALRYTNNRIYIRSTTQQTVESLEQMVADTPIEMLYAAGTPVTTQLDPIELPQLPAPTCTVWCDGGSAQPSFVMEYVKDTNIVIAEMQAALADLATS